MHLRVIHAEGRVFLADKRIFRAPMRVICAQGRGIWEEIREGVRGAAKGVSREIKRLN